MESKKNTRKKRENFDLETLTTLPIKPTARVPSRNPVNDILFNKSVDYTSQRFAHFINFSLFLPSPQGFVQTLDKSVVGSAESLALEIIGYICSRLAQKTQPADDHQTCVSFFQVVRRPDQYIIGLVWHVFYQFTELNPGEIIKDLIQENTKKNDEAIQQSKIRKKNAYQYTFLGIERYKALVSFYKPLDALNTHTISLDNITDEDHPFSFNEAFSLDTCLSRMKDAGCDEQLLSCDYTTGFPNPVDVFFVQSALLVPQKLFTYLFPHLPPATYTSAKDRTKFKSLHPNIPEATLDKIFDQELATSATTVGERTFEDLGVLVNEKKQKFIEIHNNSELTADEKQLQCEQLQNEIDTWALKEYEILLTPIGRKGLAEIAIENWFHEEFLKTHKNACMPRKKLFNNMSRVAQYINELLASCETLQHINVTHQQIILYYLSSFTAHRGRGLRIHHLGLGTAATGKSFSLMSFIKWLIEGSYFALSTSSTKAFNVAGDPYNGAIIIFEEVPRSLICTNTTPTNDTSDGSGDNDCLNIFKGILSEGQADFATNHGTVDNVAGTGSRTSCKVEACFFMATNENGNNISEPIQTRVHMSRFTDIHRSGSGSKSSKKSNQTPDSIAANEAFITRARRTQALMKKIYNMQTANILPPVEIKIAEIILDDIENESKKMGCTTDIKNTRKRLRLIYLIEVLVMIDAIDCVFDTEYSEIQNQPFSHNQMLLVRKYLVATQEHISIALGLLSSAYEDPTLHGIIETCKSKLFDQAIKARHKELNDLGFNIDTYGNVIKLNEHLDDEKEEKKDDGVSQFPATDPRSKDYQSNIPSVENPLYNRYYYKYEFPKRKGGSNDFREKFETFIDLIYDSMGKTVVNRPSRYLVGSALRNLSKQQINVYDPIDKEWSKVSKLYIDDKAFYLAIPIIDMFKADPIREALIKTLSHQYTLNTSILYGKTQYESNKPYEMPFLEIKNDPLRILRIRDRDYHNPQSIKLMNNLIEGVHEHATSVQVFKPSTGRMYSEKPLHIVDGDIDKFALAYHITKQNISKTVSNKYPAACVKLRKKQEDCIIQIHRKDKLTKFQPTKLETYDTDEWMDDKTLLDSDFTKISTQIQVDEDLNDEDFHKSIEDTCKIIAIRSMNQEEEDDERKDGNNNIHIEEEEEEEEYRSNKRREPPDEEEEKEEEERRPNKKQRRVIDDDDDDDLPSYQEQPDFEE
jgi:hypothetical protein